MKKCIRKTVDALIDKPWFLSIVNKVYNRLSSKKKAFFLRNVRKPDADFLWRIKLLNGKKVKSQTYANGHPMSQLSWDFVFSYHWYDPGMCVLENIVNKALPEHANWIDIGANMGLRSLIPLSTGRQVHLFEPNPVLVKCIKERNALNGFKNCTIVNAGVSSLQGELDFYLSKSTYVSSFDPTQVPDDEKDGVKKVPVCTLDSHFQEWGDNMGAFVKIDVEGHELNVLEGATKLLESSGCMFLIEVNSLENLNTLYKLMSSHGYLAYELESYNEKMPLKVFDLDKVNTIGKLKNNNYFFTHREQSDIPLLKSLVH
jgi:FkbM family methyltransferase